MRKLIVLVALLLSCTTLKQIPVPPTYDDKCVPTHDTYLKWAKETRDLAKDGEIPSDPAEALKKAKEEIEALGIKIVEKPKTGKEQFDGFTTTMPQNIYVAPGFWETPVDKQAQTLWHEIVHVRQWQRLGPEKFATRWLVYAHGRWSLETPAYRESMRVLKIFGVRDEKIREVAPKYAEMFYESYALYTMPKECTLATTVDIWLSD